MSNLAPAKPAPPEAPPSWPLSSFDYRPRTRVIFGSDAVEQAGELAAELGGRRILLVTDPGVVAAGHAERVEQLIRKANLHVVRFDDVRENPTTECVDRSVLVAEKNSVDLIVGLGGGSAMDTAKGCNFLLTNGGRMRDYWGAGKASKPMLPLLAIPTTAGTGSECQSFALISDHETHAKMACGDPKAAARVAILDPCLTLSQPRRVAACTGIDAIAHAVETAVTRKRNPLSLMFSLESFKLCATSLGRVLEQGEDLDARARMLLGAALAGTAIENSMLGAAHSAANPLTAHFDVVHGQAVGLMLPHVVRFNAQDPVALRGYAELASAPEIACISEGLESAVDALIDHLNSLLSKAGIPARLRDCGVKESAIPKMAEEAAGQWTANFNPRTVAAADFEALYQAAY